MVQCLDCPRITQTTAGPSRCCMDDPVRGYTIDLRREREAMTASRKLADMLLPIPGRSAERGEVTRKNFADMNRKERRAFLSGRK